MGTGIKTGINRFTGKTRKRAAVLAMTGAAIVAGLVLAVPAGAAPIAPTPARPATVSGIEHFQVMSTNTSPTSTTNPLISWGLFTLPGVDVAHANNTDTFRFPGGTFLVRHAAKKGTTHQSFNPKTCLFQFSERGTLKVGSGTGRFKGISGGGTYALSVIGIGAKLRNGTCNPSPNARAAAQQQQIAAVARIRLP